MNENPSTDTLYHQHDWQPIDGWCGRYRCKTCRIAGYRPRIVTLDVEGGPYGGTAITPYVCAVTRGGVRCGCPAEWRQKGTWKCREHSLSRRPTVVRPRPERARPKESATRAVVPAVATPVAPTRMRI